MQKLINNKSNSLATGARKEVIATLKQTVAELFRLLAGIRNAHRRSRGPATAQLDLFAGQILGHISYVAERATAIQPTTGRRRSAPDGIFADLLGESRATNALDSACTSHELADLHSAASQNVRKAVRHLIDAQDFGSADVLADVLRTLNRHTPSPVLQGQGKELMMN